MNGNIMQPFFMPMVAHEHQITYSQQLLAQQQETLLRERFPLAYVILHSLTLILIGMTTILLQVFMMTKNVSSYYLGNGIWGGAACIFPAVFCLLFAKQRSYSYFVTSLILNGLCLIFICVGLIAANMIGANSQYYMHFFRGQLANELLTEYTLNFCMVILGYLAAIICLVYFIAFPAWVFGCACGSFPLLAYYSSVQQEPEVYLHGLSHISHPPSSYYSPASSTRYA